MLHPVGLKVGFKTHKEYRHVPKKAIANSSGNKKKGVEPINVVSHSNSFDVLNTVDNDMELGTNERTSNSDGNPLKKVEYSGDHDSEDEVASVDNDMARSMAFKNGWLWHSKQDLPEELQTICDSLDIRVHGLLIKRQAETELMLEKNFRDLCEEVSNFVKEIEDMVKEVERLSCKDVAKKTICLLRRGQKRELYMMTRLQMMVDESHLSVREKHTFVSKMNLGRLD
nr:hypothetical protein [Tanacetum cinerariifolium]